MNMVLYIAVISALLLFPDAAAHSARNALIIWARDVVPSLFPYMVVCRLLSSRLQSSELPARPVAAILGICGGSPCGSAVLSIYQSRIDRKSLFALSALTGTLSPMFFLGTVRQWLGSPAVSRLLLASHTFGALFSFVCVYTCRSLRFHETPAVMPRRPSKPESNALAESLDAILNVGGCIICCSVAAGIIGQWSVQNTMLKIIFHLFLEVSGGIYEVCSSSLPDLQKMLLLCASTGFSGLSILLQNGLFLRPMGISMRFQVMTAILRAVGSSAFACFFCFLV